MEPLTQRIEELDLRFLERVGVTSSMIMAFAPASEKELRQFEARLGEPLPDDLKAFYQTCNGLTLDWGYADEQAHLVARGVANVLPLETMMALGKKPLRTQYQHLDDHLSENTFLFDDLGNGHHVLLTLASPAYSFALVTPDHTVLPLNIDLQAYVETMLRVTGTFCWQLYVAPAARPLLDAYSYDLFFTHVEHLFPEVDLKAFAHTDIDVLRRADTPRDLPYGQLFDQAFEETPTLSYRQKEKQEGAPFSAIRKAEMSIGHRLPPEFVGFYYAMNGLNIQWEAAAAAAPITANFKLLPVEEIFGGQAWYDAAIWDCDVAVYFNLDRALHNDLAEYYPLLVDDTGSVIFRLENEKIALYLYDEMPLIPLSVSFADFIRALLVSRGLAYWPYFLTEEDAVDLHVIPFDVPQQIRSLFPNADVSRFRTYPE